MSKTAPKYPIIRERLIKPGRLNLHRGVNVCDACPAGKLRCDALVNNGAVLPCENADTLDMARMTQLYGADGAKRLMEVGNDLAH